VHRHTRADHSRQLTATAATQTSISTLWSPSFDNVGVKGYDVFLNDNKIGLTPLTGYTFSGLACGTNYTLGIEAYDAAGNHSPRASGPRPKTSAHLGGCPVRTDLGASRRETSKRKRASHSIDAKC
jgi:chitodextrinase